MRCRNRANTAKELGIVDRPRTKIRPIRHDLFREPAFDDIHIEWIRRIRDSRHLDIRRIISKLLGNDVPNLFSRDTDTRINNSHSRSGNSVGDTAANNRGEGESCVATATLVSKKFEFVCILASLLKWIYRKY